jgi:hypothetical protein
MGLFSVHTLTSIYQDIGRHIRIGQIVWETGVIPSTNFFSFTVPDFPFVNHHWLGGVMLYGANSILGLQGIILAKALLMMLAFGLALTAVWKPRLAIPSVVIGLASLVTLVERTDARPEVVSFVFLGWFLFVLYRYPHTRLLWTLPILQVVWVNTHIYFFMGPFLVLAWWLGEFSRSGASALHGKRHWALAFLVAAATLCNPSGWQGAVYPVTMWSNYGYTIVENKSLFFLRPFGYPMMTSIALGVTILITALSFVVNRRRILKNIDGVILFLATTAFALIMIRNFPLLALVALPITLRNIEQSDWHWNSRQLMAGTLLILALLGVSIVTNQVYSQAGMGGRSFGLSVPVGFQEPVDFFRAAGLRGPIFNNFDIGSFLIWKLPEERVFIDGRPEAYPKEFIQNTYIRMQEDAHAWARESGRYSINTVFWNYQDITPWSQEFVARITKDPRWVPVYLDSRIIILVRDTPANAAIISKYRVR